MKINYRRELKHNYLVIEPETLYQENYECRMLMENTIPGLLCFRVNQLDGKEQFCYEITSKQPLSRLLETRCMSRDEIKALILGIIAVLNKMETYLLSEDQIMLEPEYIYIEPESFQVSLCFVPGKHQDFPEMLANLLQYLLRRADHQDKDCVVLAYGLFQESQKENYGIKDLLKWLGQDMERVNQQEKESIFETSVSGMEMLKEGRVAEPPSGYGNMAESMDQDSRKTPIGWLRGLLKGRTNDGEQESDLEQSGWQAVFRELDQEDSEHVVKTETIHLSKEPNTALLADLEQRKNHRRLESVNKTSEDIEIAYFPFIIGKQENLVDYVIAQEGVSRLHVRIDQDGDNYKITDLNSTNGTMVRDRLLENNETVSLAPGDEVWIAQLKYKFV